MFKLQRLAGLGFSKGMNRELLRLYSYSLTPYIFKKASTVVLAKDGFFYCKEHGNIKCFTCDACYSPEDLEKHFKYFSSKPPDNLHETWCLISDHGNIPMYQVPSSNHIDRQNPSCYKRKFKDDGGRLIECLNFCGLNCVYTDIKNMLKYPALKDAFKNHKPGSGFKALLNMTGHGERLNSARGMRDMLLYLGMVKQQETRINQERFYLIRFFCELMKEEISIIRSCSCKEEHKLIEQIIVYSLLEDQALAMDSIFQRGIDKFFDVLFGTRCSCCKENVCLTFSHTPPCLFLNVWKSGLNMKYVPTFITVLNKIFRISAIYLYTKDHFTAWIYKPRPNLERAYYDDRNVNPQDIYSADLDETKEFPGNECMVVVSYLTEN